MFSHTEGANRNTFDPSILSERDQDLACAIVNRVGSFLSKPDETICADGIGPYLHRWYVTPKLPEGLTYFHIQIADDPDRGLHDHPWDNQSVILAGGYEENIQVRPPSGKVVRLRRHVGEVIWRKGEQAHRLMLPEGVPYTMTLFSCGPRRRDWGFWLPDGWHDFRDVTQYVDGKSIWTGPKH